jgi:hypothetical protein
MSTVPHQLTRQQGAQASAYAWENEEGAHVKLTIENPGTGDVETVGPLTAQDRAAARQIVDARAAWYGFAPGECVLMWRNDA